MQRYEIQWKNVPEAYTIHGKALQREGIVQILQSKKIDLRKYQQLSYRQVAHILNTSEGLETAFRNVLISWPLLF